MKTSEEDAFLTCYIILDSQFKFYQINDRSQNSQTRILPNSPPHQCKEMFCYSMVTFLN